MKYSKAERLYCFIVMISFPQPIQVMRLADSFNVGLT
jgi:hypothetical protein